MSITEDALPIHLFPVLLFQRVDASVVHAQPVSVVTVQVHAYQSTFVPPTTEDVTHSRLAPIHLVHMSAVHVRADILKIPAADVYCLTYAVPTMAAALHLSPVPIWVMDNASVVHVQPVSLVMALHVRQLTHVP